MNPESREFIPSPEKKTVTRYILDCRRHGDKEQGEKEGKKPGLSKTGEMQSNAITQYKPPYATGEIFTSNIDRTFQSAKAMQETEWEEGKKALGIEEEKITKTSRLGDDKYWASPEFRNQYFAVKEKDGVTAADQWYLDFKDQKPFKKVISPEEIAAMYASLVSDLMEKLKNGEEQSTTGSLPKTLISHDLVMEPFLYYMIGDEIAKDDSLQGNTFMEKIGGNIREMTGFQIALEKLADDEINANLLFNGKEYALDNKKMYELIDKYKETWEKQEE